MKRRLVIGVDPGVTTGIVALRWTVEAIATPPWPPDGIRIVQCDHLTAPDVVAALLRLERGIDTTVATEDFVVRSRAARSSNSRDGRITRELIDQVLSLVPSQAGRALRRATDVKPWATDDRLDAAGLLEPMKGQRHARDAARHALYAAVRDLGLPNPLSKRSRA